jgi:hypothetical protein
MHITLKPLDDKILLHSFTPATVYDILKIRPWPQYEWATITCEQADPAIPATDEQLVLGTTINRSDANQQTVAALWREKLWSIVDDGVIEMAALLTEFSKRH